MNALEKYWPSLDHARECLRTEAETVDEAQLLAVHEPATLLRRAAQASTEIEADEAALLNELMRPVTDGSAVVIAITGASGVGKSHMVRWLRAQLERHTRRKELVVVSIPKTASLRRVVELVLEPLSGSEYQTLKDELARANEQLTPTYAAELLHAALGEGLREYRERIEELVRTSPEENIALRPHVAIATHVRNLVQSPEVRELWLGKVLIRIVTASLTGASDPADRQFRADDLAPPAHAVGHELPQRVQSALTYLGNADGRYRLTAADILQEVLDGALRTVLFTDSFSQKSIQDVVEDIRRQLLKDGKELVLLIEDLAALSGIQQPLLDIMISESDEHGRRVRAPIRTAFAVTDGYLAGRQTVLTRAKEQWVVPSEGLAEEAIVQKLVDLTGRYLNAARWGLQHLKSEFSRSNQSGDDLYGWVPKFDESLDVESSERLEAFGHSRQGYALFPFNLQAIRGLAEVAMRQGGIWVYNPRAFINEVLRKTLIERPAFLEGRFPPVGFQSPRLLAEVRTDLQRKGLSQQHVKQLEVALHFWAGSPRDLKVAPIHKSVFEVFSLPWPFGESIGPFPSKLSAEHKDHPLSQVSSNQKAHTTQAPTELPSGLLGSAISPAPDVSSYSEALEAWSPTNRLPNAHARESRNLLSTALEKRIDLGIFCLKGQVIESKWFWLPPSNTVGNPSAGLVIKVVEDDQQIPPGIVSGLKALARWEKNGKSWLYANAENDYAAASSLLSTLESKVLVALANEVERDIAMISRALQIQSVLLGQSSHSQPETPSLRDLFSESPDEKLFADSRVTPSVTQSLTSRAKAVAGRNELQDRLRQLIGCFQGTGNILMAIDFDRLKRAWRLEVSSPWRLGLRGRGTSEVVIDVLERVSPSGLPNLVRNLKNTVQILLSDTRSAFKDDHARIAWRDQMMKLVSESKQMALWPIGKGEDDIRNIIERLSSGNVESVVQRLSKMIVQSEEEPSTFQLEKLCAVPLPRLSHLSSDVKELNLFLNDLTKLINSQIHSNENDQALEQRAQLINSLEWTADDNSN